VEEIVSRAATHPYVPNQLVAAVSVEQARESRATSMADINWDHWTDSPGTKEVGELLRSGRGNNQSVSLIQLELGEGADPLAVIHDLSKNDRVLWSSPNFIYAGADPREFIPNDPSYGSQYHHTRMQNHLAWDTTLGNLAIKIGVIDDGVLLTHSNLQPNIWVNPGEVAGNVVDDDNNGYVDDVNGWHFSSANNNPNPNGTGNDHGTHVAGITAGRTNNAIGMASTAGGSTIGPLQFYAGTSSWTAAIISETYQYAADNGFQIVTTSYNVDGWVGDPVFTTGLQYMYDAGVLHFNSAGNNSQLNPPRQVLNNPCSWPVPMPLT
jgi:subtilisin family serine protease